MMRRFTSAPNPSRRVDWYMSVRRFRVGRAEPVLDAVVAREVARRLGRAHDVIGGDAIPEVGQRHIHHVAAGVFKLGHGRFDEAAHLGESPSAKIFGGVRHGKSGNAAAVQPGLVCKLFSRAGGISLSIVDITERSSPMISSTRRSSNVNI